MLRSRDWQEEQDQKNRSGRGQQIPGTRRRCYILAVVKFDQNRTARVRGLIGEATKRPRSKEKHAVASLEATTTRRAFPIGDEQTRWLHACASWPASRKVQIGACKMSKLEIQEEAESTGKDGSVYQNPEEWTMEGEKGGQRKDKMLVCGWL